MGAECYRCGSDIYDECGWCLLRDERDALARWKTEAMEVMDGIQELGRILNVELGRRCTGSEAAAAAAALLAEREALLAENTRLRDALTSIANEDYRGNRPWSATVAHQALNPPEGTTR